MECVSIKELFVKMQESMLSNLDMARLITHPGAKGDYTEEGWIKWLNQYLPKRYAIDKAKIIDHTGATSDQIDVVIYDRQYSPLVFNHNEFMYIPAESIYAIFEVKQELNKVHLDYASEKADSVRKLERESADVYHAGGMYPHPKFKPIIAGILTTRCTWADGMGSTFKKNISNYTDNKVIDIGCCLCDGSFTRNGSQVLTSTKDEALVYFFIQLHEMLRKVATVPPINMLSYAKSLESEMSVDNLQED